MVVVYLNGEIPGSGVTIELGVWSSDYCVFVTWCSF